MNIACLNNLSEFYKFRYGSSVQKVLHQIWLTWNWPDDVIYLKGCMKFCEFWTFFFFFVKFRWHSAQEMSAKVCWMPVWSFPGLLGYLIFWNVSVGSNIIVILWAFCKWHSVSHTLLRDIYKFLFLFYIFYIIYLYYSIWLKFDVRDIDIMRLNISFVKTGEGAIVLSLWPYLKNTFIRVPWNLVIFWK